MFTSMRVNATTVSYDPPFLSSLTPHDPISITSDSNFTYYSFLGSGTVDYPYLIDGYNITTTDFRGISITDTTKHFVISNCYVDATYYGIYIVDVAYGTASVINNTCSNNNDYGILLWSSDSSTVANNTCSNNGIDGIYLLSSDSSTVSNNTCSNNNDYGIELSGSGSSTVSNNTCSNNGYNGIYIDSSGSSTVSNNTCNYNSKGIDFMSSDSSTVSNNTCNNNWVGIWFVYSDFCNITYNLLQENEIYGVYLVDNSYNNNIHHNTFVDNHVEVLSQAKDGGANNYWYDTETLEGNYWDDWSGTGSYSIDGTAGAIDLYPLDEPTVYLGPPVITNIIHSPSSPTELDAIIINAIVTNPHGVQSVTLHYRVNSGTWIEVSLTLVSGDLYSVTIGPFAVSDTIEYYITAVDDSIHHNEVTDDNSGLYYSFTIDSSDNTGPVINDIVHSPSSPTELDTITINATVTDTSGVQSITLHYRVNGGTWIEVSMTLVSGDIYTVTLGSFTIGVNIEYYITAVDDSIHHNEVTEDNSGQYYDILVGSSDVTGPIINDIVYSPSLPTELDTVTINATVTDDSGVQSVTLYYKINDGSWQTISMTLVSGDIYSVTIGPFAVSNNVEYYITAVDNSINHNEVTEDNGGFYYVLTIGSSDVIGPIITDIIHSPSTPKELDTISINATVTDDSGIYNVTLHYRINDGNWIEVSMTLKSGDLYNVTIGPFAVGDIIEYYVSAIDNSASHNETTEDNAGLYYSFTVAEVIPEFQMFSLLLPVIVFLFLGFGLVVLHRRKK